MRSGGCAEEVLRNERLARWMDRWMNVWVKSMSFTTRASRNLTPLPCTPLAPLWQVDSNPTPARDTCDSFYRHPTLICLLPSPSPYPILQSTSLSDSSHLIVTFSKENRKRGQNKNEFWWVGSTNHGDAWSHKAIFFFFFFFFFLLVTFICSRQSP